MSFRVIRVVGWEETHRPLFARLARMGVLPGANGTPYVTADFASISRTVYDRTGEAVAGHTSISLTPADVISDTLVGWTEDDVGYNFDDIVPDTAFPAGSLRRIVDYTFTLSAALGSVKDRLIFDVQVRRGRPGG